MLTAPEHDMPHFPLRDLASTNPLSTVYPLYQLREPSLHSSDGDGTYLTHFPYDAHHHPDWRSLGKPPAQLPHSKKSSTCKSKPRWMTPLVDADKAGESSGPDHPPSRNSRKIQRQGEEDDGVASDASTHKTDDEKTKSRPPHKYLSRNSCPAQNLCPPSLRPPPTP